MSIDVQIWSDINCPWCYIGKRRFEKALAQFPQRDDVRVTWRSFQLDPSMPEHDERTEIDYLVETKGMPRGSVEQMVGQVAENAAGEGLHYDFEHLVVANSRKAHRVLQLAKQRDAIDGGQRGADLKELLLSAHFEQGKDVGDVRVLAALAEQVGIDPVDAEEAAMSSELDQAVDADIALGAQIGVRGVPFFVFDGKYGVSGAQPAEVFGQVLEKVASEQSPSLISVGDSGEACGPDGC